MAQGPTPRSTNTRYYKTKKCNRRRKNMHIVFTRNPMADRWTSGCRSVVEVKVNKEGSKFIKIKAVCMKKENIWLVI